MREDFIHYIWKLKLINANNLKTTTGSSINIISYGQHNSNSGPDFTNAKIKIDNTIWIGNIEIHVNASEWFNHKHHLDSAFNNVILHVVYNNDLSEEKLNNHPFSILELKELINNNQYILYENWINNKLVIPCGNQIRSVKTFTINNWLERLFFERLENRYDNLVSEFEKNQSNREELFYQNIATYYGAPVNKEPFEQLSKALPLNILAKHKNSLLQLEALLFGASGLIEVKDSYSQLLNKEFNFLGKKFNVTPLQAHSWKFGKMRPVSFPTIRIAQLASLVHHSKHLYSQLLSIEKIKEIYPLFSYPVSDYWKSHFHFGESIKTPVSNPGKGFIDKIILNVIIPFLFFEGKLKDDETMKQRAFQFAMQLKAESNNIINQFEYIGLCPQTAAESQALLELKKYYCDTKQCLKCGIGYELLNPKI